MSFAELCGLVSIPSCVRVSNAVVILSLISFLSFGWCWVALRSRHISSIPCVVVSLMDRASQNLKAADAVLLAYDSRAACWTSSSCCSCTATKR